MDRAKLSYHRVARKRIFLSENWQKFAKNCARITLTPDLFSGKNTHFSGALQNRGPGSPLPLAIEDAARLAIHLGTEKNCFDNSSKKTTSH
jgi:hypothetical protein